MATYDIKQALDQYFQDNFTTSAIQYHGNTTVKVGTDNDIDPLTLDDFISVIYSPVMNERYGAGDASNCRIEFAGIYKVFCYAKNPVKAFILADAVKTFLNGKQIGNITVEIGQDRDANDLDNGFYECLCLFNVSEWA